MTASDRGGVSRLATALVAVSLAAACQRAGLEAVATPEALGKALRDRLGDFRPFRPRLSVDLGWEECAGPAEGDPSCGAGLGGERLTALVEVGRRVRPSGGDGRAEAHAGALLRLIAARSEEDLDAAVSALEALAAAPGRDERVLIDLGAAYLVRALASGSASGLIEAVDAAARAAHDAPDQPAAWYNLALAQELMALPRSATEAVERLQEVEPGSPFAAELRQGPGGDAARGGGPGSPYLAAGAGIRQLVTRSPQRAHEHLLDELLPAWAADVQIGRAHV